ncbi:unnamed protein product, partial [Rotaria sp. Silwood2]
MEYELKNDDQRADEFKDAVASHKPTTTKSSTSRNLSTPSSITLYALRYADLNHNWKIQAQFDEDIKFDFSSRQIRNVQE